MDKLKASKGEDPIQTPKTMNNTNELHHLVCPHCSSILDKLTNHLRCPNCRTSFPINDGIADLQVGPKRIDNARDHTKIINGLSERNWTQTVRLMSSLSNSTGNLSDEFISSGAFAWKFLLNIKPEVVLVDVGCGSGNLTSNLAPHVTKTYALNLSQLQLRLAKKRFSLFNRNDDITLLAIDEYTKLPFAEKSIDCVILNNMGASVENNASIRDKASISYVWHQNLIILKEVRRILKDDGQLYITLINALHRSLGLSRGSLLNFNRG